MPSLPVILPKNPAVISHITTISVGHQRLNRLKQVAHHHAMSVTQLLNHMHDIANEACDMSNIGLRPVMWHHRRWKKVELPSIKIIKPCGGSAAAFSIIYGNALALEYLEDPRNTQPDTSSVTSQQVAASVVEWYLRYVAPEIARGFELRGYHDPTEKIFSYSRFLKYIGRHNLPAVIPAKGNKAP